MKNFVPIAIGMNVSRTLYLLGFEILFSKLFRVNSILNRNEINHSGKR